jgi:redox-sensing transcriptional repressor
MTYCPHSRQAADRDVFQPMDKKEKIPDPTVARLPLYFRCLAELHDKQITVVSSEEVANRAGIKASQFRKDLSYFGEFGIQGLGYPVDHLLRRIGSIMQLDQTHRVVMIGAGNLGTALAGFPGFVRWGFQILWIFDASSARIGEMINSVQVEDIANLPRPLGADLGILAVPATAAQTCGEILLASGVQALLNFSGATLSGIPRDIVVRNVDLTHELAILAYHLTASKHT